MPIIPEVIDQIWKFVAARLRTVIKICNGETWLFSLKFLLFNFSDNELQVFTKDSHCHGFLLFVKDFFLSLTLLVTYSSLAVFHGPDYSIATPARPIDSKG